MMASLLWTRNQQNKSGNRAPSSLFSSNLSPRQIANKAYSLAIKKLDRDDKRSRPHYNVRERLLLCNTLTKAEQFLQKRTPRTNRRVMAFEEDDSTCSSDDIMTTPQQHNDHIDSPLSHMDQDDDDDDEDDDDDIYLDHQPTTPDTEDIQDEMTMEMALSKALSPMGSNAFVIPQDDEDFLQYPSSFLIPNNNNNNNNNNITADCRPIGHQNPHLPIASII
ncbi:uncharacterized protein BX664DRAFT_344054 [Halteromyces radiatus]|uniref:uncharacterized protein n=1 Tax=Halteromyces radiatus TaxID=101107 RepID=UPI00222099DF|nr:uncharacterized protein BX664DRAFT_344054 [Halteromyces radiatus]KAI8076829.1 hypothetical protein BX664DRAFT_344054 [Halteromyces radiatus]